MAGDAVVDLGNNSHVFEQKIMGCFSLFAAGRRQLLHSVVLGVSSRPHTVQTK